MGQGYKYIWIHTSVYILYVCIICIYYIQTKRGLYELPLKKSVRVACKKWRLWNNSKIVYVTPDQSIIESQYSLAPGSSIAPKLWSNLSTQSRSRYLIRWSKSTPSFCTGGGQIQYRTFLCWISPHSGTKPWWWFCFALQDKKHHYVHFSIPDWVGARPLFAGYEIRTKCYTKYLKKSRKFVKKISNNMPKPQF